MLRYLPAILWAALLFLLSSLPSTAIPTLEIEFEDLYLHFIVYGFLGFFLGIAFWDDRNRWQRFVWIAILGVLYGASDEFHQSFVPGRFSTVSDFIADSLGAVFGLWLYTIRHRIKNMLGRKSSPGSTS